MLSRYGSRPDAFSPIPAVTARCNCCTRAYRTFGRQLAVFHSHYLLHCMCWDYDFTHAQIRATIARRLGAQIRDGRWISKATAGNSVATRRTASALLPRSCPGLLAIRGEAADSNRRHQAATGGRGPDQRPDVPPSPASPILGLARPAAPFPTRACWVSPYGSSTTIAPSTSLGAGVASFLAASLHSVLFSSFARRPRLSPPLPAGPVILDMRSAPARL